MHSMNVTVLVFTFQDKMFFISGILRYREHHGEDVYLIDNNTLRQGHFCK